MAATETGVWDLQDVRDKQLASEWSYDGATALWVAGAFTDNNETPGKKYSSPVQISGSTWGTTSVGNGYDMSAGSGESWRHILKTDGTLWGIGGGSKLGLNNNTSYSSPKQVGGSSWRGISGTWGWTAATQTDGTLWFWGEGPDGVTGQNIENQPYSSPKQIPGTNWSQWVLANRYAIIGVKTDGTLWSWGSNSYGVLGLNAPNDNYSGNTKRSSPTQVGTDTAWGDPKDMDGSAIIKSDGSLWMWGANHKGSMGQNQAPGYGDSSTVKGRSSPNQMPGSWSRVTRPMNNTMAVKTDGTLWVWGDNGDGLLGLNETGSPTSRSSPTQVPGTTWKNIYSNSYSTIASKTDNTIWTWGNNQSGQLGLNDRTARSSPVQVPGDYKGFGKGERYGFALFKNN